MHAEDRLRHPSMRQLLKGQIDGFRALEAQ